MKAQYRIGMIAFVVAVLVSVTWLAVRPQEPVYRGKPLSVWLERYYQHVSTGTPLPSQDQIVCDENAAAIRQIGTNGIPFLLKLISTQDSQAKRLTLRYVLRPATVMETFGRLVGAQSAFPRWASASMMRPHKAWLAFRVLGPVAKPAIPGLIQVMRTSPNPHARRSAAYSLGAMVLSDTNALLDLVEAMNDPDVKVRDAAWAALFGIAFDQAEQRYRPECVQVMVPRLTQLLTNPKGNALGALALLSNIGPDAKDALPAVLPFLDSSDRMIRDAAVSARDRMMGH